MTEFDRRVERRGTSDLKWNRALAENYLGTALREDMIPMWIADTDFACPPFLLAALRRRIDREIFGYCAPSAAFGEAVCWWQKERFGYQADPGWVVMSPTVVASINIAVHAFTLPGDGVIIQQPVYDPFAAIVTRAGRTVVNNGLVCKKDHYEMDFALLGQQVQEPRNKLLILCSPHNPVGRVWTRAELERLAHLCLENNVLVVADEIHADIVFGGRRSIPLLSLSRRCEESFIQLVAPGKTFNIPGLKTGCAIIPDPARRKAFADMQTAMSLDIRNTFALEGLQAVYTPEGAAWADREIRYLEQNAALVGRFLAARLPQVRMIPPEGTFLCWLDFSRLGLSDEELIRRVVIDAGVVCVPGPWFGPGGAGHLRLNIGCPAAQLTEALERIAAAVRSPNTIREG